MSTAPMIDDDGQVVRNDYCTQIDAATRVKNYKAKSAADLAELNWKLNQIETNWGNHAARTSARRAIVVPTDALLAFRANIEALRTTWATIQKHQAAGRILFADAIAKTGRHKILFTLDSVLTSPELKLVLSDLTPHKLRRRLPPASGPIPIAPLIADLVWLLRSLESRLEPVAFTKRVRGIASHAARCDIASRMLKVIQIDFSAQAIRNATMHKLP